MKRNLHKLNRLVSLGIIDIEDFYLISVTKYNILLQGKYNPNIIQKYAIDFNVNDIGFVVGRKRNIEIILTD